MSLYKLSSDAIALRLCKFIPPYENCGLDCNINTIAKYRNNAFPKRPLGSK